MTPLERLTEFARQFRLSRNADPSGDVYNIWLDPNAEPVTLNLNDIESLVRDAREAGIQ